MTVVKLWQQGLILLGLPLLCQIFFAVLLIDNLARIDNAAARESAAKQIMSACQEVRVSVFKTVTFEAARKFMPAAASLSASRDLSRILPQQVSVLKKLSAEDPVSRSLLEKYIDSINKFVAVTGYAEADLSNGDPKMMLSRFVNEREYLEEILVSLSAVLAQERQIQAKFAPVAREFRPESMQARKQLLTVIFAGIAGNVLVVLGLALAFGRKTLSRMQVLMSNIETFSRNNPTQLQALHGEDELAELDRSFRDMASARLRAEQTRRTLMEMVSHDLRSPLSSCSLTLSMVLQAVAERIEKNDLKKLARVNSEMKRLVRMSDGLLAVEKLEAGQLTLDRKPCFVEDLLDAALDAVRGAAEIRSIRFDPEDPGELQLKCDKDRVIQVLVNLLSNSVKFSPENSTIKVKVAQTEQSIRIEVVDQGPGIPEEKQTALFQRFSQLDKPEGVTDQGSGLGLYICKLLVEAHGGRVGVISPADPESLQPGTCFWVEFPNED